MDQFHACQSWNERNQELFQPLSSKVTATVRAGWWAYHCQGTHNYQGTHTVSSTVHPSSNIVPSKSHYLSHIDGHEHRTLPTYGYGYGTDF